MFYKILKILLGPAHFPLHFDLSFVENGESLIIIYFINFERSPITLTNRISVSKIFNNHFTRYLLVCKCHMLAVWHLDTKKDKCVYPQISSPSSHERPSSRYRGRLFATLAYWNLVITGYLVDLSMSKKYGCSFAI